MWLCMRGCLNHTETACVFYRSSVSWANVAKCANFPVVVHVTDIHCRVRVDAV